MAHMRYLYPRLNFILTHCSGIVDDHSLLAHMLNLEIQSHRFKSVRELVDLRKLRYADRLTVFGLMRTAEAHKDFFRGKDFSSAVVVDSPLAKTIIELYAWLVSNETIRINIFMNDVDGALKWLGYGNNNLKTLKDFIHMYA